MPKSLLHSLNENLPIRYCMICTIFSQKNNLNKTRKEKEEESCLYCGRIKTIKIHVDNPHILIDNNPSVHNKEIKDDDIMRYEYYSSSSSAV